GCAADRGVLHRRFAVDQRAGARSPPLSRFTAQPDLSLLFALAPALYAEFAVTQRAIEATSAGCHGHRKLLARAQDCRRRAHSPAQNSRPTALRTRFGRLP